MKRGDIVLVKYPFTDLSAEKLRPALVVLPEDSEGDLLLAFITSNTSLRSPFDVQLPTGQTGLRLNSTVRLKKMMCLHTSLVAGKIGSVPPEHWRDIERTLRDMFGFR